MNYSDRGRVHPSRVIGIRCSPSSMGRNRDNSRRDSFQRMFCSNIEMISWKCSSVEWVCHIRRETNNSNHSSVRLFRLRRSGTVAVNRTKSCMADVAIQQRYDSKVSVCMIHLTINEVLQDSIEIGWFRTQIRLDTSVSSSSYGVNLKNEKDLTAVNDHNHGCIQEL